MTPEGFHIERVKIEEPARRQRLRASVALALTALASLPIFHAVAQHARADAAEHNAYWNVSGQPCQPLAPERFTAVSTPPQVTTYDGIVYQRHGGAMTCTHRVETIGGAPVRYPVCKFTAPDYLAVVADGRETFYDLTMGRAASVAVVNGQVRCGVTAKFAM
jgi:hypothetical protein